MGGFGSGRTSWGINTSVSDCRKLDVGAVNDDGFLEADYANSTLEWKRDNGDGEETVASVGVKVRTSGDGHASREKYLRLRYTVTHSRTDETHEYDYRVPLEWTPCNFGGERPWFCCPRCDDRVGKLYKPPRRARFLCRDCHDLVYESQQRSGGFLYENITKPARELRKAQDALDDEFSRENLRRVYEADVNARDGMRALVERGNERERRMREMLNHDGDEEHGDGDRDDRDDEHIPFVEERPSFEEWLDGLFSRMYRRRRRGTRYGEHGRCEATAKTTGERCRQPATGEHGKCYYHGGAPNTGAPEGNQNAANSSTSDGARSGAD
jgi:hypothetical protein